MEALDVAPNDGLADELRRRVTSANDVRPGIDGSQRQEMVLSNVMLMSGTDQTLAGAPDVVGSAATANEASTAQAFANLSNAVLTLSDENSQAIYQAASVPAPRALGSSGPADAFLPIPRERFRAADRAGYALRFDTPANLVFGQASNSAPSNVHAGVASPNVEHADQGTPPAPSDGPRTPPAAQAANQPNQ